MKFACKFIGLLALLFLLQGCQTSAEILATPECQNPDGINRVMGGGECLVLYTSGTPNEDTTLIVFIHGDGTSGGPTDYFDGFANQIGSNGVVAVALIRPGYFDRKNRQSSGTSYRSAGDGYRPEIITSVADAVTTLKRKYDAKKLIVVGYSGGAAITGVMIGMYPKLVDYAVLVACPCNVPNWRIHRRGVNTWTNSLSPHDFIDKIDGTNIIALTGKNDTNTELQLAIDYVEQAKSKGVNASVALAPGYGHGGIKDSRNLKAIVEQVLLK